MGEAKLSEDGVCVVGDARQVLLVGRGNRGALNAVYTYLENVIGCHWPEPGQDFVPKLGDWKPSQVHLVVNPPFSFRGIAIHGACGNEYFAQIVDWLAKNRMNAFQVFPGHYDAVRARVIELVLDRGLLPNIGGHSREYYLSTAKYRPEHPDWFATNQGKKTEQICYSNYESVPTYASNVVAYLKSHPEIAMVSLWPNDGYGFCECTRCKAAAGSGTDLLLAYVNRVAEKVHAEVPGVKLEFLAYIHYLTAPTPRQAATLRRAHLLRTLRFDRCSRPLSSDHRRPCSQPAPARGVGEVDFDFRAGHRVLLLWRRLHQAVPVPPDSRRHRGRLPLLRAREAGWAFRSVDQSERLVVARGNPVCLRRASWDRDLNAPQIEANYYQSLFGRAAEAMKKHAAILGALHEQHAVTLAKSASANAEQHDARLRQYAAGIREAKACLESAQSTNAKPYVAERIRKLQVATDYLDLWFQIQCDQHRFVYVEKSAELRDRILANVERS